MKHAPAQIVSIDLAQRSYPILIGSGLIAQPLTYADLPQASQALIVTNATVAPLYLQACAARCKASTGKF
ncbi:MAG: 3-dehydroquinate synthase, partial [Betaproteobacteria bacterium]|nr:3-dehydroquinate synthase [Betaproteobacteria bacterium]